ncbi:tyrosine-type recombinase/integrase [Sinorhizobium meliloti]|uniref:tyrosine-type recombinase/integrase n=1 Tax=Rhizobium meliloti TaxID=382 RepID=UPI000FD9498E|nr:site-specific integrase [Sinorhizobium meliloti]RVL05660.1 site-specific integrase [Sinorhizobium meliloti]RVN49964.1 site-specific integrase [Sinorhizobium meliloti]
MPKEKLTDRRLKTMKPAEKGKRYEIGDAVVPGLAVRVTDKGTRTFILVGRMPGKDTVSRPTIGEYGVVTLEAARAKAREWLELMQRGINPQLHVIETKAKEIERQENTFGALFSDYKKKRIYEKDGVTLKLRNGAEVERSLRSEFVNDKMVDGKKRKGLKDRPITGITKADIIRVIDDKVDEGHETQAHNLFAFVRMMFNWAIDRGVYGIETSPCDRLKPKVLIGEKNSRDRVLTNEEIKAFWIATGKISYPYGPLYRILLMTGVRKNEAGRTARHELHMNEALWSVPKDRMKGGAIHHVPLSDLAVEIFKALPLNNAGAFLFSTTAGEKPVNGFSKGKVILDREMLAALKQLAADRDDDPEAVTLKPFVIHDIRRTVRTNLSALGVQKEVAEAIIAHKKKGVHAVYDQWEYLDEKRVALQLWANRVRSLVEPPQENVVPIRKKR